MKFGKKFLSLLMGVAVLCVSILPAFAADVVYILMKPLEWVFVIALYLIEEKPEDKIASQYLPLKTL